MARRLYSFTGSDEEYIKILEHKLIELNYRHSSCLFQQSDSSSEQPANTVYATQGSLSTNPRKRRRLPEHIDIVRPEAQAVPRQNAKIPVPRWKADANRLVCATPDARSWDGVVRAAGLDEIVGTVKAASRLLDQGSHSIYDPATDIQQGTPVSLLEHVQAYARSTLRRKAIAVGSVKLAAFQEFLFLSTCVVLHTTKVISWEDVMGTVRICCGGDRTERYCQRVLDAVKYINQLVDMLKAQGWGDRAAELVMLCGFGSQMRKRCSTDEFRGEDTQFILPSRLLRQPESGLFDRASERTSLYRGRCTAANVHSALRSSLSLSAA